MLVQIAACILAYLLFKYYRWATYFKRINISSDVPFPLFGNLLPAVLGKRPIAHVLQDHYELYSTKRYVGFYNGVMPTLFIRDPELIKKITIKDFDVFPQHMPFVPKGLDDVWDKSILAMPGGKRWQDVRSTLSPTFTASKMKMLFELMKECSRNVSDYYLQTNELVSIDIGDTFKRYASDVIVTSALGVTTNSLKNRDDDFYRNGLDIVNSSALKGGKAFLLTVMPSVLKALGVRVFQKSTKQFFTAVILESIRLRKEKSIFRPDVLQLMLEAQSGKLTSDESTSQVDEKGNKKTSLTNEDIVAQAMLFYLGGFDTASTTMSHTAHELAVNPEVQAMLREEVDETLAQSENGEFTYENVMGMKYLDGVVSETLRKWPPFPLNDRYSVKPYLIEPENGDDSAVLLESGSGITIPIYAIQRDPKYFPNPDKFDPDRFSDENKHNIVPFTYIPFGTGPRVCIASRFALLETKLIIAELISKFEIVPVEKTVIPMKISTSNFNPIPEDGFWLGLTPRKI